MLKVQRTDLGWRGNKTSFRVLFNNPGGGGTADPTVLITDSKVFTWTAAAPTDSGREITRYYRDFVIQRTNTDMAAVTVQVNAGGGWVTCPTGFIEASTNVDSMIPLAVLLATTADNPADLVYIKLPPGCNLRLSITNIAADATGEVLVQMSNSSEKPDVSRS